MMTVLSVFTQVINGLKLIQVNLGIIQLSLFDLTIGVFIISCISKIVLRWLLDNRDIQIDLSSKLGNYLDRNKVSREDIWTVETDYLGEWQFRSKESYFE